MRSVTREQPPFWSYYDLALLAGLAMPSLLGGALIARGLLVALGVRSTLKAVELLPGQFFGYALLFAALAFLFRARYERPFWRSLGWEPPPFPVLGIAGAGYLMALFIALMGGLMRTPEVQTPMRELLADRASLLWVALFGVTFGPLSEELVFRGLLQPLFVRSLGAAGGILLAGAAFGLLHLPQYAWSWRHALLISLAGAGFGWMRQVSGSTAASTLMHAAYNLALFNGYVLTGKDVPRTW